MPECCFRPMTLVTLLAFAAPETMDVDYAHMATPAAAPPTPRYIQFEVKNDVAHVTLNHPDKNVLTTAMMVEIAEAIESLEGRNGIKAILLDSAQKAFSY